VLTSGINVAAFQPLCSTGRSWLLKQGPHLRYATEAGVKHGFSNCGTRTTTGTPAIVYLYADLIKNRNIKMGKKFTKINETQATYIY
jgi:hypothetical protein